MPTDPGLCRVDLVDDLRQLIRLAAAQLALARLKEALVNSERQVLGNLKRERSEIMDAVMRMDPRLMGHSATARRLDGLNAAISFSERQIGEMTREAITASARHEVLLRRARNVRSMQLRKEAEMETQEVVQAMGRKATHKDPMVD